MVILCGEKEKPAANVRFSEIFGCFFKSKGKNDSNIGFCTHKTKN